jgi:hypothetical protein
VSSTHSVTYLSVRVQPQIANAAHPEPRAARKARLVHTGLQALACGDWLAVAIITTIVMKETRDA